MNPDGPAAVQLRAWDAAGETDRAFWLRQIADRPVATWFGDPTADPRPAAAELVAAASARDETALLVAYNIPGRDCDLHSAGGLASHEEYLDWVRRLAGGIGDADAIVVLEPDAVPHALEGCLDGGPHTAQQRYDALREATGILKANPATRVYVDAGNAGWIEDLDALAGALRASGLEQADGFALNVSNFKTTESSTSYGRALSDRTSGAHFVIDTSRNGAGPAEPDGSGTEWCNPQGRHLGPEPTLATGVPRVDAHLWVKQPGDSDGACRPGEPTAGTWWPEYALDLVMNTRMGHPYTGHP